MGELIGKMVNALEGGTQRQRRERAWTILALMVGSMTVARALPDGEESSEVIHAALKSALGLLKQ
jgi:TetR/AcrR family transcriptional repressor of nem operon